MTRLTQEHSARRISPENYECELPPDVRSELTPPKRPRILRPTEDPTARGPFIVPWIVAIVAIGAIVCLLHPPEVQRSAASVLTPQPQPMPTPQQPPVPRPQPTPESTPELTPQSEPEPTPIAQPTPMLTPRTDWQPYLAPQPTTVPRAVLVKLPTPRAELIRLPEWRIGESRQVMMPYGMVALATYKGRLASEAMLPVTGNAIGDTWMIGDTPWVYLVTPGTSAAQWVDP